MTTEREETQERAKPEPAEAMHELEITYKIDGEVVKVIRRQIDEKYRWFLLGNMSWREW